MNIYKLKIPSGHHESKVFYNIEMGFKTTTPAGYILDQLAWVNGRIAIHELWFNKFDEPCPLAGMVTNIVTVRATARKTEDGLAVSIYNTEYGNLYALSMSRFDDCLYIEGELFVLHSLCFITVVHKPDRLVDINNLVAMRSFMSAQQAISLFIQSESP